MNGWPTRWRSLGVLSFAWEIAAWTVEKIAYQFDPRRKYP